jgi:hypothetical protein
MPIIRILLRSYEKVAGVDSVLLCITIYHGAICRVNTNLGEEGIHSTLNRDCHCEEQRCGTVERTNWPLSEYRGFALYTIFRFGDGLSAGISLKTRGSSDSHRGVKKRFPDFELLNEENRELELFQLRRLIPIRNYAHKIARTAAS